MKTTIRLREVVFAHFGRSEATLYDQLPPVSKAKLKLPGDAICFISRSFNQVCFVFKVGGAPEHARSDARVVRSARVRLTRGQWSPLMFQEYASEVGLVIAGFPTFQQHFDKFRRDKYLGKL